MDTLYGKLAGSRIETRTFVARNDVELRFMRLVMLRYMVSMTLVAAITSVAVLWCHLSHLHVDEGPVLLRLTANHGIAVFDVVVLAVELVLLALLSATLLIGFTDRR